MPKRSVVTEVGVFAIGVGAIIGLLMLTIVAMLPPRTELARHLSVAMGVLGGVNVVTGILVLTIRHPVTVVMCMIAAGLVATLFLVMSLYNLAASSRNPGTFCGTFLWGGLGIATAPLLIIRGIAALKELKAPKPRRRKRSPPATGRQA